MKTQVHRARWAVLFLWSCAMFAAPSHAQWIPYYPPDSAPEGLLSLRPNPKPECAEVPSVSELGQSIVAEGEVQTRLAARLNLPFSDLSGSGNRRIFVKETARYAECLAEDSVTVLRYGVTARLTITMSTTQAAAKLTLPFIAASTELGLAESAYQLEVFGSTNRRIEALKPETGAYNIENYNKLTKAIDTIWKVVWSDDQTIRPVVIAVNPPSWEEEVTYGRALAAAWSLQMMTENRSCREALDATQGPNMVVREGIDGTYRELMGVCDGQRPGAETIRRAKHYLGQFKVSRR